MPVVSLNQSSSFTESCEVGGVKSQGSSTVLPKAAQTNRAGTVGGKRKYITSMHGEIRTYNLRGLKNIYYIKIPNRIIKYMLH